MRHGYRSRWTASPAPTTKSAAGDSPALNPTHLLHCPYPTLSAHPSHAAICADFIRKKKSLHHLLYDMKNVSSLLRRAAHIYSSMYRWLLDSMTLDMQCVKHPMCSPALSGLKDWRLAAQSGCPTVRNIVERTMTQPPPERSKQELKSKPGDEGATKRSRHRPNAKQLRWVGAAVGQKPS